MSAEYVRSAYGVDFKRGSTFEDRLGDVGEIRDGIVRYPETADMTPEHAARKYGPLYPTPTQGETR